MIKQLMTDELRRKEVFAEARRSNRLENLPKQPSN
jgi:hypothetical protein